MDVLKQAQALVTEHMFLIGVGLLAALLLAGIAWFWMSRGSKKDPVLANTAEVNNTSTLPQGQLPTQEQLEEMARLRSEVESQQDQPHSESE